jgi:hypothetical protein
MGAKPTKMDETTSTRTSNLPPEIRHKIGRFVVEQRLQDMPQKVLTCDELILKVWKIFKEEIHIFLCGCMLHDCKYNFGHSHLCIASPNRIFTKQEIDLFERSFKTKFKITIHHNLVSHKQVRGYPFPSLNIYPRGIGSCYLEGLKTMYFKIVGNHVEKISLRELTST